MLKSHYVRFKDFENLIYFHIHNNIILSNYLCTYKCGAYTIHVHDKLYRLYNIILN